MYGGTLHFDPVKKLLEVRGQIIVDHIESAPATDGALDQLFIYGKTRVTIRQRATGDWEIKYVTALPAHFAMIDAAKKSEERERRDREARALEDQDRQAKKAAKDKRKKARADAGEPPEPDEA